METFVVRVWTPANGEAEEPDSLHGVVEHVDVAQARPFRGEAELLRTLRAGLRAAAAGGGPSSKEEAR